MNLISASLLGNILAFLALSWKTIYDLRWNPGRFKKQIAAARGDTEKALIAGEEKRKRENITTTLAFLILSLSYLILIGDVLMSQNNVVEFISREIFEKRITDVEQSLSDRIKILEDKFDPPGGGGMGARIESIEDKFDKLETELQKIHIDQAKNIQRLLEITAELKHDIKELKELKGRANALGLVRI